MPRVLLVEDDENQLAVRKMLLEHQGYEVSEARTADEALSQISPSPELALMDLSLPTPEEGLALVREINIRSPKTRIAVLTGWIAALRGLESEADPRVPILQFELSLLREIGRLPDFDSCSVCDRPIELGEAPRYWVSQGGLICPNCGRPEFQHTEIHPGSVAVLRKLASDRGLPQSLSISPSQFRELRRLMNSAICYTLERRPRMLGLLKF